MRRVLFCAVAVVCFGLPGCASTSGSSGLVRSDRNEVDVAQVAAVNALAQRRGVNVTWVNPPVKRVPSSSGLSD